MTKYQLLLSFLSHIIPRSFVYFVQPSSFTTYHVDFEFTFDDDQNAK
jgi:hypothetical protein